MPLQKLSLILNVTTEPQNRGVASAHSGGWSEGWWWAGDILTPQLWQDLAALRAAMLPSQVTISGWRNQQYTVSGNRLLPGGSVTGKLNVPGGYSTPIDLPQNSLEVSYTVQGRSNSIKQRYAGVPDDCITFGEYSPTRRFTNALTAYANYATGLGGGVIFNRNPVPFNAVVRDLSVTSVRVNSITSGGAVLLAENPGATFVGDYLIFHRVYDQNGNPVKGSFLISTRTNNVDGTVLMNLANYNGQVVVRPNGLARIDKLAVGTLNGWNVGRALVRKIGRPSQQYRGRRSKSRV